MICDWLVIGAGPAGITALGKLKDQGIENIGWMDPHFAVGDLGMKWSFVSSNTTVQLFLNFLHACKSFDFKNRPSKFSIEHLDPKLTCPLHEITQPLQWITDHLKKKVHIFQTMALELTLLRKRWEIKTNQGIVFAKNIVLAIGSEPKMLPSPKAEMISLETALHPKKLQQTIAPEDTIAVFGSSHSAILILEALLKLNVKQVINFYRSPHRYAIDLGDWILFDDTGLKGFTAQWAKDHIDGSLPSNLTRVLISAHDFEEMLSLCNKMIYAVGFERRKLPILEQYERLHYDDKTGIIAPGLFGLGIAFPQAKYDPLGHLDFRVGLWKFMDYLNSIMPIWIKYANQ